MLNLLCSCHKKPEDEVLKLLQLMQTKGLQFEWAFPRKSTLLHEAIMSEYFQIARWVLKTQRRKGINLIDVQDFYGNTILHILVGKMRVLDWKPAPQITYISQITDQVKYFVTSCGANYLISNSRGEIPFDIASEGSEVKNFFQELQRQKEIAITEKASHGFFGVRKRHGYQLIPPSDLPTTSPLPSGVPKVFI